GREGLRTKPKATGSAPVAMTIGIVLVSLSRREVGRKWRGNDHAWIEAHQPHRQLWQTVKITISEPKLEAHVTALDISEPPHALSKTCQIAFQRLRGSGAQNSDHGHHRLLRTRGERPPRRRYAAEQRDEV